MKKCHKCKLNKPLTDFPNNKAKSDGHSETCLACKREYNKEHYRNNKSYYVAKARRYKETVRDLYVRYKALLTCLNCGECHPACLQFHHREPGQKNCTISDAISRGCSAETIAEEIKKCDVLCANCHAKEHWRGLYPRGETDIAEPSEGSVPGAIPGGDTSSER